MLDKNESGFFELVQVVKEGKKASRVERVELKTGIRFTGAIKSIKGQSAFVEVPTDKGSRQIGRLHMIECQGAKEFNRFAVGDRIEAKILSVKEEGKRTWIELTRREKHMEKMQGLDEEELSKLVTKEADLTAGKKYKAMVLSCSHQEQQAVNLNFSHPMLLQISPFVSGTVPFNQIVASENL